MTAYLTQMWDRIKSLLFGDGGTAPAGERDGVEFATAALMVEAASLDGSVDAGERRCIAALLQERFGLPEGAACDLLAAAERRMAETHQLYPFTRVIKDSLSETERLALIEMLWEVIYSDGRAHDYEANLMRRIGGLIYIRDVDIGAARRRVLERIARERSVDQDRKRPGRAAEDRIG